MTVRVDFETLEFLSSRLPHLLGRNLIDGSCTPGIFMLKSALGVTTTGVAAALGEALA
jgi:hypothetical protein